MNTQSNRAATGKILTDAKQLGAGSVAHNFEEVVEVLRQVGLPEVEAAMSMVGAQSHYSERVVSTVVASVDRSESTASAGRKKKGDHVANGFIADHDGDWTVKTIRHTTTYQDTIEMSSWSVANGLVVVQDGQARVMSSGEWALIEAAIKKAADGLRVAKADLDAKTRSLQSALSAQQKTAEKLEDALLGVALAEASVDTAAVELTEARSEMDRLKGFEAGRKRALDEAKKALDTVLASVKKPLADLTVAKQAEARAASASQTARVAWEAAVKGEADARGRIERATTAELAAKADLSGKLAARDAVKSAFDSADAKYLLAKAAYEKVPRTSRGGPEGVKLKAEMDLAFAARKSAESVLAVSAKALADSNAVVQAAAQESKAAGEAHRSRSTALTSAATAYQKAQEGARVALGALTAAEGLALGPQQRLQAAMGVWEAADAAYDEVLDAKKRLEVAGGASATAAEVLKRANSSLSKTESSNISALKTLDSAQAAWGVSTVKYEAAVSEADSPSVTIGAATQKVQAAAAKTGLKKALGGLNTRVSEANKATVALERASSAYLPLEAVFQTASNALAKKSAEVTAAAQTARARKEEYDASLKVAKAAERAAKGSVEHLAAVSLVKGYEQAWKDAAGVVKGLTSEEGALKSAVQRAERALEAPKRTYVAAMAAATSAGSSLAAAQAEYDVQEFWANNIVNQETITIAGAIGAKTGPDRSYRTATRSTTSTTYEYWSPLTISFSGGPDFLAGPEAWYKSEDRVLNQSALRSFDLDGKGARLWEWVGPTEGILVWNPSRNALFQPTGKDLFGNITAGLHWEHGYEPLAKLDKNKDGLLNGRELFGLDVWLDGNTDAVVQQGELRSLEDHGIVELRVTPTVDGSKIWVEGGAKTRGGGVYDTRDWFSLTPTGQDPSQALGSQEAEPTIYVWEGRGGVSGGFRFYKSDKYGMIVASLPSPREGQEELPVVFFRVAVFQNELVWRGKEEEEGVDLRTVVSLTPSGDLEGLTTVETGDGVTATAWRGKHVSGPPLSELFGMSAQGTAALSPK